MEYNPTVWEENDLISPERMNKIERGIQDAFEQEPPEGLMPSGGTTGQMLVKASDTDFDAQWEDVPEDGVTSFNGRSGDVVPESGDYTAEMVGAIPSSVVSNIQLLEEADYDALVEKAEDTLYLIPEDE